MSEKNMATNIKKLTSQYKYVYLPDLSFYKSWRFYIYLIMLVTSVINLPLAINYDINQLDIKRPVSLLMAMNIIISIAFIVETIRRKVKVCTWRRPDDIIKSPEKRVLIGQPIAALVMIAMNLIGYFLLL